MTDYAQKLLGSRRDLVRAHGRDDGLREAEGGCGVTGFACTIPVGGRHIYEPSVQMHNRGNGKGGGIAAVGLTPDQVGVSQEVLDSHYLMQIALLDPAARDEVEQQFILPSFDVALSAPVPTIADHRDVPGLEVRPPDVHRYVARVKPEALREFAAAHDLGDLPPRELEDEFVYRNSYRLNNQFYASLGAQRAFVLCHGRNLAVFKIVGFAEQIVDYYQLEDFRAHIWIAHQRYPTKGRVWHPGGAHPFVGLNEALVHNGDFANYHSVTDYLRQRNIHPQFLTDTEVSVLLFDLWDRVYKYPLEYIIEALAPTTELDFDRLPEEKQRIYRQIQAAHMHGSPDGPWFFIIARSLPDKRQFQLLGITDTAMLRPQVFALATADNDTSAPVQIGLICSEKQAIDATLRSLAREDARFCPVADRYWNARGGSHTDGGAFIFTVGEDASGGADMASGKTLHCADKFGRVVAGAGQGLRCDLPSAEESGAAATAVREQAGSLIAQGNASAIVDEVVRKVAVWTPGELRAFCDAITVAGAGAATGTDGAVTAAAIGAFTMLRDRRFDPGDKRRSSLLQLLDSSLERVFDGMPRFGQVAGGRSAYTRIDWETRSQLAPPRTSDDTLVIDAQHFAPEGEDCDAVLLRQAYELGWRWFICYRCRGQRFTGCGLGPATRDVRIDVYGSSGDYLASGIDGLTVVVHDNAQDQLGQIMKAGKLVVHGDVGQTFMYGAKGGDAYVLGNAAGRPLINAVGHPRVVINGTCLDFLAESFMAGDPLGGGGFVVLNGVEFDARGEVAPLASPYPGGNLFSLASGGAIYLRDPQGLVGDAQLNGGEFVPLTKADWRLIRPYLEENERLFGIPVTGLLTVAGELREPQDVYRKLSPARMAAQVAQEESD